MQPLVSSFFAITCTSKNDGWCWYLDLLSRMFCTLFCENDLLIFYVIWIIPTYWNINYLSINTNCWVHDWSHRTMDPFYPVTSVWIFFKLMMNLLWLPIWHLLLRCVVTCWGNFHVSNFCLSCLFSYSFFFQLYWDFLIDHLLVILLICDPSKTILSPKNDQFIQQCFVCLFLVMVHLLELLPTFTFYIW
jgi:hypothetical protein